MSNGECEARTSARRPCGKPGHAVMLSVPFKPGEPRSDGAVGRALTLCLCGTHKRMLVRADLKARDRHGFVVDANAVEALLERWAVVG